MELKKVCLSVFAIIILFSLVANVQAVTRPIISISNFEVDSGSLDTDTNNFELRIDLKNSGDSCARAVIVSAQATSPFITDETPTTEPTDICEGDSDTVNLPLQLEPNTMGGSYSITLVVNYEDANSTSIYSFSNPITLFIKGNSEINAHIVRSSPLNVYPGDTATISIIIENDGTFQAQSIKGILSANSPLEVKSSQSFFSVGSLQPKQSYLAEFSLDVPKDAQAESYPMSLSLEYTENGVRKTKNISLVFEVKKRALFSAYDSGSNILYPDDSNRIIKVRVMNTGTDVAKDIKVQVQPQFPFTTDGSIKYISKLEPFESSFIQFAINVDKDATVGNYAVDLIVDFKDSQGNVLYDSTTTSLSVQNKGIFQKAMDYWYLWIIALIIIVILIARKRRKSQKEEK